MEGSRIKNGFGSEKFPYNSINYVACVKPLCYIPAFINQQYQISMQKSGVAQAIYYRL